MVVFKILCIYLYMAQRKDSNKKNASGENTVMRLKRGTAKDGKKALSPQAADYYKRLILVSERYLILLKEKRRLRVALWFVIMGWVATILIAINPLLQQIVPLIRSFLE